MNDLSTCLLLMPLWQGYYANQLHARDSSSYVWTKLLWHYCKLCLVSVDSPLTLVRLVVAEEGS